MKQFSSVLFFVCIIHWSFYAQNDSIITLDVVNLQTVKLKSHSKGFKILTLPDSIILKNTESFSNLLRFNAPIFIKEYGSGGTSSASFRGTSASNTAVVWNGININSINTGQTDFNALNISLFDHINIRSGGGSIEFGSGAIGGTIHLNNEFKFGKHVENQLISSIGSYETYQNLYKVSIGNDKTAVKLGLAHNISENNYKWLNYDVKNENGAYKNTDLNLGIAHKISKASKISFHSSKYNGVRHFSGVLPNPSVAKEKYKDISFRNLLTFEYKKNNLQHAIKLAYLTNEYQYFSDKNIDNYNFGASKTQLINYNFNYKISVKSSLETVSEFENVSADTDEISEKTRNQFAQSLLFNHQLFENVGINAKVRKDFNTDYKIPLVYALGTEIKTSHTTFVRINGSKNYKVPSFNDLYWPALGNKNLIPESSLQADAGIVHKSNNFKLDIGGYYINTKDKIV